MPPKHPTYGGFVIAQLKQLIDDRGLSRKNTTRKADFIAILVADDESKAQDADSVPNDEDTPKEILDKLLRRLRICNAAERLGTAGKGKGKGKAKAQDPDELNDYDTRLFNQFAWRLNEREEVLASVGERGRVTASGEQEFDEWEMEELEKEFNNVDIECI